MEILRTWVRFPPSPLKRIIMEKEYILCAAIKRIKPRETNCGYYNNDIHKIELGYRHHDILQRFPEEVSRKPDDQGFYTSKGRFVSRQEAAKIAYKSDQIENEIDVLYSENLY